MTIYAVKGSDNPADLKQGTVKLTDFLEVPLIDMPSKSMICGVGSNRFRFEKEGIQVNLTVPSLKVSTTLVPLGGTAALDSVGGSVSKSPVVAFATLEVSLVPTLLMADTR